MGGSSFDNSRASAVRAPSRSPLESGAPDSCGTVSHTRSSIERAETLGVMTEIAVHEIGNVLGWLTMSLDLAGREVEATDLPPRVRERLAPVLGNARLGVDHIAGIVRELRDLRRPVVNEPEPIDPTEALRAALLIAGPRIAKRARLVEELWPVPFVRGRKHDLVCVFLNLLLNAAEAIPEGEASHVVTIRAAVDPGGTVLFEIEDTGSGVPEEIAESVFEPYVTSRGEKGGRGLGLHVCRRIVREMGGKIGFEPCVQRGTRFWIVLPHAVGEARSLYECPDMDIICRRERESMSPDEAITSDVRSNARHARKNSSGTRSVLVVDDDVAMRRLLERELSPAFEVIGAANIPDAMTVLRERGRFLAAIVTDKDLGSGQSGLAILEAARRERLTCVRILVSGDMHDGLEAELAAVGLADAAFGKPWPPKAVARCVADLLGLMT